MQKEGLFNNYKYCDICGVPLPVEYEDSICPTCKDNSLFREVKDFIRSNDVTEYDVATEFNIPLLRVKQWIREGRIEYKSSPELPKKVVSYCKECGAPISFGALCSKCLKKQNVAGTSTISPSAEAGRMRYLDED